MSKPTSLSLVVAVAAACALLPAAAPAYSLPQDVRSSAKECKAERGTTDESRDAFRIKYGTGANGRNAFGRCVSIKVRAKAAARRAALRSCLAERGRTPESRAAFKDKYATAESPNPLKGCVALKLAPSL